MDLSGKGYMSSTQEKPRVFYVEDDRDIRDLTQYALHQAGFECVGFPDATEFFAACADCLPDLVLLDIMLPGIDGREILSRIRGSATLRELPVIMLTAKGTEFDVISGLDAGADDYLAKPFSMMELISRSNALLRRTHRSHAYTGHSQLVCGELLLDVDAHKVLAAGKELDLTYKEFKLLQMLMENPDYALSRAQLFQEVWDSDFFGETRTVDVHMQTLRQKLEQAQPGMSAIIETVRSVGYRLRTQR